MSYVGNGLGEAAVQWGLPSLRVGYLAGVLQDPEEGALRRLTAVDLSLAQQGEVLPQPLVQVPIQVLKHRERSGRSATWWRQSPGRRGRSGASCAEG